MNSSILASSKSFICAPKRPGRRWGLLSLLMNGHRGLYPQGIRRLGRDVDQLHLVPWLRINASIHLFHLYTVMVWAGIDTYFTFTHACNGSVTRYSPPNKTNNLCTYLACSLSLSLLSVTSGLWIAGRVRACVRTYFRTASRGNIHLLLVWRPKHGLKQLSFGNLWWQTRRFNDEQ
jgi:hypothetical protein